MTHPLSVPIIKPVNGRCNFHCRYCYMDAILEPQKSDHGLMGIDVLKATVDFFCSHQNEVEFIWHGGEPLLAGKQFYVEVGKAQEGWRLRGKKIANSIQTNGALIDENWATTLKKLDFHVGVSLDAPPDVHDSVRITSQGRPTFLRIMKGISNLRSAGIFNGVSCCIGKRNFRQPEQILKFFLDHQIKSLKFLRIRDTGIDNEQPEGITADEYTDFLIEVFKLWLHLDDPELEIRDIRSIVDILLGGSFRECTYMGQCEQFVTVYNDGSIYPCDSLINDPSMKFGTVFDPYQQVLSSPGFRTFLLNLKREKLPCKKCRWKFLCKGGCLGSKLWYKQQRQTDWAMQCRANQRLFEEIEKTLSGHGILKRRSSQALVIP